MSQAKIDSADVPIGVQWLRQWRCLHYDSYGTAFELTVSGVYTRVGGAGGLYDRTITVTEDSIIRIQFQCMLDRYAGVDSWDQIQAIVRNVTDAVTIGGSGGFVYHSSGGANRASWSTIAILAFAEQAADTTKNYQVQYYSYVASELRLLYPSISIDICKM